MNIRGDQVEYFQGEGKVVASGNVEAVYRDSKLTCDQAVIYMATKDAYLRGRVRLVQLSGFLKGEEMIYNFETKKGTVLEAEGEAGPWRTRGERAQKIAPDAYIHRGGYLTSCDFEQPHTRLQAKEVKVFLDDRVVLKNAVMYVGRVPVLYVPSYTHPLDDKRPRVTIIPGKSKEWGPFLLTSWRVYLHENLQGRFHVDYRERLDLATGLDLKYRLPVGGEGLFREYYTNQRSLQRKHFYSKLTQEKKDKPTVEQERYRFQLRHLWEIDDFTRATLEYHRARDTNVTKDFFEREFEEGTGSPPSYFQIARSSPWYGLTFLLTRRVNRYETVTQQLPFIAFNVRPLGVPWLPRIERWLRWPRRAGGQNVPLPRDGWFYQSSYNFERSDLAEPVNGTEDALTTFNTVHELFYPMRVLRLFNFRPFFRFRETMFSRGAGTGASLFRQAGAAGFDLNTKFFRVFPWEIRALGLDIERLRHVVTPTLTYEYQGKPTLSADRFVRSDGLAKSNTMTPGIEQKLQTKRMQGGRLTTVDVVRFNSTMPYDVEGGSGHGGEWNSVNMDLELLPYSWMRVEADATVDPHIGKVPTINADLVLQPGLQQGYGGRGIAEVFNPETGDLNELPWALGLGWRYQRNTSAQLTLETEFNLGRKWRVGMYQGFDVKRFVTETSTEGDRTVKKIYDFPEFEYRLRRDLHEWTVELIYNVQRQEGETLLVLFRLKAAPELPVEFERSYHRPKGGRNFKK